MPDCRALEPPAHPVNPRVKAQLPCGRGGQSLRAFEGGMRKGGSD
jgi:hypothetical protein